MRIVLYNPRSSANRKPILPMSLLAVGAVLEGRYDYRIVDGNLDTRPLETLHGMVGEAPADAVLGVTVMPGPQLAEAVPLCQELKRRHPDLTVIWGGYFPSQHWQACLRSPFVDLVVRGHGEQIFAQVLASLERGVPDRDRIPGLCWRDDGEPHAAPPAALPHPDRLPEWNLDRVEMERYLRATFLGRRTVAAHSSYGCPHSCRFCAVVTMAEGRWLAQSAERVARTFAAYRSRYRVDAVELTDNNFFVHEGRTAEVAARVRDLGMAWWAEGRVDTMLAYSSETWQALRDSGLRMVFLGAESGSQQTLQRMDKGGGASPEATLELVRVMASLGIVPELSFVLGSPPDPEADAAATIALIRRIKRVNPATEIVLYLYTPVPVPGELLAEVERSGFAFPETLEEWVSLDWLEFAQRRGGGSSWIRPHLRQRVRNFERVLNAYYPTSTLPSLTGARRWALRLLAGWRYHSRIYRWPLELAVLQRLTAYQRPETTGF